MNVFAAGFVTLLLLSLTLTAQADELLYVYGPDCGACMKFQKEVGVIYDKTAEAKWLPITRVTLEDWQAGKHPLNACDTRPVYGTPTFIQLENCREIDRITGYSNDELFWLSLGRMVNAAKANQASSLAPDA